MTTPDTITTGDGRTIPPPEDGDDTLDMLRLYHGMQPTGTNGIHPSEIPLSIRLIISSLVRRCHAAEAEVRRQAEENASLRERVARHGTTSIRPVFPIQSEDMP